MDDGVGAEFSFDANNPIRQSTNPWEVLNACKELDLQDRQQYLQHFLDHVNTLKPGERDAIVAAGREVFKYRMETIRGTLREMDEVTHGLARSVVKFDNDEILAEAVYRPGSEQELGFLVHHYARPDDPPEWADHLEIGKSVYYPINSALVTQGVALFPTTYEEYGTDHNLFLAIRMFIRTYLQLDSPAFLTLACGYVMMTWLYDRFDALPYLRFQGDAGPQPLDAKILTPTGWTTMGALKVGDFVIAGDGTPVRVLEVKPQGTQPVYQVICTDGSTTRCTAGHLWTVQNYGDRQARHGSTVRWRTLSLSEIAAHVKTPFPAGRNGVPQNEFTLPMTGPVQFPEQPVPVDPYVLGALLGNGSLNQTKIGICTPDEWVIKRVESGLPETVKVIRKPGRSGRPLPIDYYLTRGYQAGSSPNPLIRGLKALGLRNTVSATKFVPDAYLYNSPDVRHAVLQGLMDTDGTAKGSSTASYSSTSRNLAESVAFLAQSLGGTARVSAVSETSGYRKTYGRGPITFYSVAVSMPPDFPPFSLPRKAARLKHRQRVVRRFISRVEPAGDAEVQCITVDHPSGLYVTDDFIVTHNSGKTTATYVVGSVCYRPTMAGGAITESPVFRVIDMFRGTLVIDEGDFSKGNSLYEGITKILNAGYRRGFPVLRSERSKGGDNFDVAAYDVFGPKILNTRRRFEDVALETRCFTHVMPLLPDINEKIPLVQGPTFRTDALRLRNMLLLWRFRHYRSVQVNMNDRVAGAEPRINQIIQPLLAAVDDQQVKSQLLTMVGQYTRSVQAERRDSLEGQVVSALFKTWLRRGSPGKMPMRGVTESLREEHDLQNVTDRKVGDVMRRVLSVDTRASGGLTHIYLTETKARQLCARYGVALEEYRLTAGSGQVSAVGAPFVGANGALGPEEPA